VRSIAEGEFSRGFVARGKPGPGHAPGGARQGLNDYTGWFAGNADMAGQLLRLRRPVSAVQRFAGAPLRVHAVRRVVPRLPLQGVFTGAQVREALAGRVLGEATLSGTYTLNQRCWAPEGVPLRAMQEPARLFVLRHGQTAWNAEQRIQGHLDMPLNAVGLAGTMPGTGAAGRKPQRHLQQRPATRPRHRSAAGRPCSSCRWQLQSRLARALHFGQLRRQQTLQRSKPTLARAGAALAPARPRLRPRRRRSLRGFYERSVACALAAGAAAHAGQSIALVAHGGVLDCLYRAALGMALRRRVPGRWPMPPSTGCCGRRRA
jgi:broad specificity phosphatase PhoE